MKQLLIIDNYDSFTYNLVHYFENLQVQITVARNDQITITECDRFDAIVLSPGPGIPSDAGNLIPIIHHYKDIKPLLGICLGHQAIAQVYGASISNLTQVYHGISTPIYHDQQSIFNDIPNPFNAGRYHSWIVDKNNLPDCLMITAYDQQDHIMGLQHRQLPIFGLQFHPESIMTTHGMHLLNNFIKVC